MRIASILLQAFVFLLASRAGLAAPPRPEAPVNCFVPAEDTRVIIVESLSQELEHEIEILRNIVEESPEPFPLVVKSMHTRTTPLVSTPIGVRKTPLRPPSPDLVRKSRRTVTFTPEGRRPPLGIRETPEGVEIRTAVEPVAAGGPDPRDAHPTLWQVYPKHDPNKSQYQNDLAKAPTYKPQDWKDPPELVMGQLKEPLGDGAPPVPDFVLDIPKRNPNESWDDYFERQLNVFAAHLEIPGPDGNPIPHSLLEAYPLGQGTSSGVYLIQGNPSKFGGAEMLRRRYGEQVLFQQKVRLENWLKRPIAQITVKDIPEEILLEEWQREFSQGVKFRRPEMDKLPPNTWAATVAAHLRKDLLLQHPLQQLTELSSFRYEVLNSAGRVVETGLEPLLVVEPYDLSKVEELATGTLRQKVVPGTKSIPEIERILVQAEEGSFDAEQQILRLGFRSVKECRAKQNSVLAVFRSKMHEPMMQFAAQNSLAVGYANVYVFDPVKGLYLASVDNGAAVPLREKIYTVLDYLGGKNVWWDPGRRVYRYGDF